MALTDQAHNRIRRHFEHRSTEFAIDATCGNGHDTEFLAQLGFKHVWGFDIQTRALAATHYRLEQAGLDNVTLVQDNHQCLDKHVQQPIDCAMFNLGYLPHGDKSITTEAASSIAAVMQASKLLSSGGLISILCYPGHATGAAEAQSIQQWLHALSSPWRFETVHAESPKPTAPVLYLVFNDV